MKIYTKTGDKGTTGLYGGTRVSKSDERIEVYGLIDELLSHIGIVHDIIDRQEIKLLLNEIQYELFTIGSYIASSPETQNLKLPPFSEPLTSTIEETIDNWTTIISPLKHFILPGGHLGSSHIHVARTICRKAERHCVRFDGEVKEKGYIIQFLNRLSDFLFVLARYFNHLHGVEEIPWIPKK